jgi:hypothetical protein
LVCVIAIQLTDFPGFVFRRVFRLSIGGERSVNHPLDVSLGCLKLAQTLDDVANIGAARPEPALPGAFPDQERHRFGAYCQLDVDRCVVRTVGGWGLGLLCVCHFMPNEEGMSS